VQWITAEESSFLNFASLFFSFLVYSRLTKYPLIGLVALGLFFFSLLFSDNALDLFHFIQFSFCLLGTTVMILFKQKHYKSFAFLFLISFLYLFVIKSMYLERLDYEYEEKSDLSILNENNHFLIGHHYEHPDFNSDTVYLVNFSFKNCLPCRQKKKSLKALYKTYKHFPFKIIEVHSFESMKIFQDNYSFDYAETYHDSLNHISQTLNISGAPTEIIFNKKGYAVRRLNGFNSESESSYILSTNELIKELINEK
jgi:thiol-disulfide isomerase/thioredoxin